MSYDWRKILWEKEIDADVDVIPQEEVTFIGQSGVMEQLEPWIKRLRPFPHVLIRGEPGLGKTQLARWIAYQRSEPFAELMCPVSVIPLRGIVLLDEAHLLNKPEWLYKTMEIGTPTIIAATTRPDKLDGPFRERFFLNIHLDRYDLEDIVEIIHDLAPDATDDEVMALAKASAGSPRQARRLVETADSLNTFHAKNVLAGARITADGLTDEHIRYLIALKAMGRPTGVGQIAVLMYTDEDGAKQLERILFNRKLIQLKNSGRVLTHQGASYLKQVMGG